MARFLVFLVTVGRHLVKSARAVRSSGFESSTLRLGATGFASVPTQRALAAKAHRRTSRFRGSSRRRSLRERAFVRGANDDNPRNLFHARSKPGGPETACCDRSFLLQRTHASGLESARKPCGSSDFEATTKIAAKFFISRRCDVLSRTDWVRTSEPKTSAQRTRTEPCQRPGEGIAKAAAISPGTIRSGSRPRLGAMPVRATGSRPMVAARDQPRSGPPGATKRNLRSERGNQGASPALRASLRLGSCDRGKGEPIVSFVRASSPLLVLLKKRWASC